MAQEQSTTEKTTTDGEIINGETKIDHQVKDESLYSLLCLMIGSILFPDSKTSDSSSSFLQRVRDSFADYGPKIRKASVKTGHEILIWTRSGSPLRALLVISVGTILLLTTMALLVFMLFFVAATANAIIISILISLAIAGGFLALFFVCITAIYIGALSVAAFVISATTISAVVSVLIASGWIGFFYVVWLGTRGGLRLAKQSVSVMGSAISSNTFNRPPREVNIASN